MNIVLSWDLFVIVVFVVIIAYSFIIGLNGTLKTIIGTYLAILASDGLGNIFYQYVILNDKVTGLIKFYEGNPDESMILAKVVIFVAIVIILSVKGAYEINAPGFEFGGANMALAGVFGFLSAGLIVSTLLVYISGISLLQAASVETNIADLYTTSELVKYMVDYYNFWFSLPVVALLIWSLFFNRDLEI